MAERHPELQLQDVPPPSPPPEISMDALTASLLDDAIENLGFTRQGVIAEAANIPDESWDFRPHPEAKNVSELVRHIIESAAMLVGEATDPEGDFQRRAPAEHVQAHAPDLPAETSPAELRELLETTGEELTTRVREAGADLMFQPIRRFDGGTWRRLMYVFYAASHEAYHQGQLAMYARTMGLVPALTQKIREREAK
jgi:uncharacterized damage-inducible protein DinB